MNRSIRVQPAGNDSAADPTRSRVRGVGRPPAPGRLHARRIRSSRDQMSRALLLLQRGEFVSVDALITQLFGDRSDGGPICAEQQARNTIHDLRALGFSITTQWGRGYRLADALDMRGMLHGTMARCLQRSR